MFKPLFKTLDILHSEMGLAVLNCGPTKILISEMQSDTSTPSLKIYDFSKSADSSMCQAKDFDHMRYGNNYESYLVPPEVAFALGSKKSVHINGGKVDVF
jgi:hypothetical protein